MTRYCRRLFSCTRKNWKLPDFPRSSVTPRRELCSQMTEKLPDCKLMQYLRNKIKATGPITVAEYMKEVLTNPYSGYYMHGDTFGASGDFITSPEISQMFGELIAVWFYNEWSTLGKPTPLQLIELGPGRGTLSEDILRVFQKLKMSENFSLHLVEVSQFLRRVQRHTLCNQDSQSIRTDAKSGKFLTDELPDLTSSLTKYGVPVTWHSVLQTVPNNFSLVLAHEFFDALPIHILKKVQGYWKEVLIDVDETSNENSLRYIVSRHQTPASKMYIDPEEKRELVEVSIESGILMRNLSEKLEQYGGIALIIDYGYSGGEKSDTFRSFRKHKQHDPLLDPGTADLTADVDFSYLIKCAMGKAAAIGPVSQNAFLKEMSIDFRLKKLLSNATPEQKEALLSGFKMLTDPEQMGERYKFLAMYPAVLKEHLQTHLPPGFNSIISS